MICYNVRMKLEFFKNYKKLTKLRVPNPWKKSRRQSALEKQDVLERQEPQSVEFRYKLYGNILLRHGAQCKRGGNNMANQPIIDKEMFKRSVQYNIKTLYRKTLDEATDNLIASEAF